MDDNQVSRLVNWIDERYRIYQKKQAGKPKPWTTDSIFQKYKFCNVFREDDTVTQWIKHHIMVPYHDNPNLWFMLCLARQINWPDTLQELMDVGVWPITLYEPMKVLQALRDRQARGEKVYTGAYMIQGDITAVPGTRDKPEYTCIDVLTPLWLNDLKPLFSDTLESYHIRLMTSQGKGWGSFMAGQAVADIKHIPPLNMATDHWDWAAVGPGSSRGLNRMYGRPIHKAVPQKQAIKEMREARLQVMPLVKGWYPPDIDLQNFQNCLCEFDKYERVRLNQGRPRSLYNGG